LGTMQAKNGVCKVEKVAINAVMAGASPKYLPVIIAAVEAFCDPNRDQLHAQASLGGFEVCVWVSGAIVDEINMNCYDRLWTYGNRAQTALGHAIMLCRINLGQMWPAFNDMARSRTVWETNWTFAENEHTPNPWKPYHTKYGIAATDSAVSVSTVNSGSTTTYSGAKAMDKVQSFINAILAHRSTEIAQFTPTTANPSCHPPKYITMIAPATAVQLNDLGYDQQKLTDYVYDQTCIPWNSLTDDEKKRVQARIDAAIAQTTIYSDRLPADIIPKWQAAAQPGGKVPLIIKPEDDLHFIVVGQPTDDSLTGWSYMRAPYNWTSHGTAKIKGAKLTKAGK
jgi:hypothetical protein